MNSRVGGKRGKRISQNPIRQNWQVGKVGGSQLHVSAKLLPIPLSNAATWFWQLEPSGKWEAAYDT